EDGIRVLIVTGVQTCALPIFRHVVLALLLGCAASVTSGADRFTGFITRVGEDSLEITTRPGTSRSVRTTGSTRYMKWVTHQPWQQPAGADRASLQVDRCVQVQLQSGEPSVARIIRINTDPPGSIADPCRRLR